ncbi:MAG TPA: phage holin family protein [Blastocatellia bacterium]|nr:phage holin family protein [Blastocatellia bacterium]
MQMPRDMDRGRIDENRESFGELLGQLANNSAALVRDEIALAKQEMGEKVERVRSGVVTTAIGAVLGLVGLLALTAAAIVGLGYVIGMGLSALIIGAVLALAGLAVAMKGIGLIKRTSLKPEQTVETMEENKQWLKELT